MPDEPTPRDLRIDLIRGMALLVIFSDHVFSNPLRRFMPVSQGLSDMAEVFIFLSGYLNGTVSRKITNRTAFVEQLVKCTRRCLLLYAAILLVHLLVFTMVDCGIVHLGEKLAGPPLYFRPGLSPPSIGSVLTLKCLMANVCVLALYLPLLVIVSFVPELLRRYFTVTVCASCQIYLLVQLFPAEFALPEPWASSLYFNPFAWQLPFVLGIAFGIRPKTCKACIPSNLLVFLLALVAVVATGLYWILSGIPYGYSEWKPTLAPVRLVHFYSVLIVGRKLLGKNSSFLNWPIIQPILLCGRHPLPVYCTGALLSTVFEDMITRTAAPAFGQVVVLNLAGWAICVAIAYIASEVKVRSGK